jgi:SAM-dependent methyltransferase
MNPEKLKLIVREKYGEIASQNKNQNQSSCCGSSGCCDDMDYTVFSDDYSKLEGYHADADLGLGCGIPTQYAAIRKGDHVLDLGSGAGNDCFVARTLVGETGTVTGIDFTGEMLIKANENLKKTGFKNIQFVKGDIENMPLPDNSYDVVISNCVLNLVPDKQRAFSEIYRVLKPGGHFCISDIVITGQLPDKLKEAAEMYAGCVSGALQKEKYLDLIRKQGFHQLEVKKEKEIVIPNSILLNYISLDELKTFKKNRIGIFSITVNASKSSSMVI